MERPCTDRQDDQINLLYYWRTIWRQRWMICGIAVAAVVATIAISLSMTNIYQARAVIMPVTAKDSGSGGAAGLAALAQQFGGVPGISMPGSASASEIVSLLKSNILRERVIRLYNLMPVLFSEQWDAPRQTWKDTHTDSWLNPRNYASLLDKVVAPARPGGDPRRSSDTPDTWDALRMLNEIVRISQDVKQNTITISVDFPDPDTAAKIAEYFLVTLTNYMSSEAKRVAATNRKYLEEQSREMAGQQQREGLDE